MCCDLTVCVYCAAATLLSSTAVHFQITALTQTAAHYLITAHGYGTALHNNSLVQITALVPSRQKQNEEDY